MHTIKELQAIISRKIEAESACLSQVTPVNLYEPIAYTLDMGGKRLRPAMVLLACNLFQEDVEVAVPAALAIEVFHNFTLLHDDIMDHADVRRNKPTVHRKYNENVAILSGDAMSIKAYQYLFTTEIENIRELALLFSQTALEICEGQQYDMDFENRQDVTIAEYLEMIRLKTAVLLGCSLKSGALVAGAGSNDADRLYDFGIRLGLAFQLQDDLLDVFADQEKFGKNIGGDIVANKKTFLLLKALELAQGATKQQLTDWITCDQFDASVKIREVRAIYEQLGVKAATEEMIEKLYHEGLSILSELDIQPSKKEVLIQFSEMIISREH